MPYRFLSPSACANDLIQQLTDVIGDLDADKRQTATKIVRQLIREQYEHCAQIAEDWVVQNDVYEEKDGLGVGDAIAEEIRMLADERASARKPTANTTLTHTSPS